MVYLACNFFMIIRNLNGYLQADSTPTMTASYSNMLLEHPCFTQGYPLLPSSPQVVVSRKDYG